MKKINIENEIAIKIKLTTSSRNFEFNINAKRKWAIFVVLLITRLIYFYFKD